MKTLCITLISITSMLMLGILTFSCQNDDTINNPQSINQKLTPSPIAIPSNSLVWDESYHPDEMKTKASSSINHSSEMAVTTPNIYIGGLYTAASIEDLTFSYIPNPIKSIDIAYTFPRYYFDHIERPSVTAMYRSINKAIESPAFTGKQSLSFEYDFREFTYWKELKLAFGANVNIAGIFKLDASINQEKIKGSSGLFARIVQKNYSLIMDYPQNGNIFLNETDLNSTAPSSPLYINSIIFGRIGIIAIESDYSYNELKTAFKVALTAGKINGELNITSEQKTILQSSQMKLFVSGGIGQDVAKIVEGYDKFKEFIINGGEFTKDVPGVPIFFTANYAADNSVFSTTFTSN
jgi:Thiol-activated cytolysin.